MKKFNIIKELSEGSFGIVSKAENTQNGELYAIKKMKQKFKSWEECLKLRELKALQKLKDHPNIVKLKEIVQVEDELNFIFEYVETNIYSYYNEQKKTGKPLSHEKIKSIIYQIASAIKYMHQNGFFHRDLKPENILITQSTGVVKLIDFGLAREIRSRPPFTDYVSTRWYRAPELLLSSTVYNSPVDIFALGLIMAELFEGQPLFQGSSDLDQLQKYCSVLGTPSKEDWVDGHILATQKGFQFRNFTNIPIEEVLSNTPFEAQLLIQECLRWDPQKRPNITKILNHSYFKDVNKYLPQELGGEMKPVFQPQKTPSQQKKLGTKDSINLDELDEILNVGVDNSNKQQQIHSNLGTTGSSQIQQQQKQDNSLYNFNNVGSQQRFQPYNQGVTQQQQPSGFTNLGQLARDRDHRPNSFSTGQTNFGFNQQNQQQQQTYSPDRNKPKHNYTNTINNSNKKDDTEAIIESILKDSQSSPSNKNNNDNLYDF